MILEKRDTHHKAHDVWKGVKKKMVRTGRVGKRGEGKSSQRPEMGGGRGTLPAKLEKDGATRHFAAAMRD